MNDSVSPVRPDYDKPNYDRTGIAPYKLEDPLQFLDGSRVGNASQWPRRREEILKIFAENMFGQEPPKPETVITELIEEKEDAYAGFGIRSQYRMWFKKDKSGPSLDWLVMRPRYCKKARPILFLNYKGNHELVPDPEVYVPEGMWSREMPWHRVPEKRGVFCDPNKDSVLPIGMLLSAGYAILSCCYCQISPDPTWMETEEQFKQDNFAYNKIFELWGKRDESRTDNITAIGAWAWALSRGLDLAERIPGLDAKHNVVTGCSRLGKAAFLAAARDERFDTCVPIQCGGGGVTLAKRDFGENIATEVRAFRHWYCRAYDRYQTNPAELLTFDQHLLLAAIAPRKVLVAGFNDEWFDTEGEYLACKAASPAWEIHGLPGFPKAEYPDNYDTSAIGPYLGYYRRTEKHGIAAYDWLRLLKFAGWND